MKRIVLLVTALFAMAAFAQNSLNLVFTGVDQHNNYVRINSVNIENLTRGWVETILFPDTVYTLEVGTDVIDHQQDGEMQVMPNPFDGQTRVNISSAQDGPVTMVLVDINGKRCAAYSGFLLRGDNFFEISLTTPQVYVLSVTTPSGTRSLKMVNQGHAGADRIWPDGNAEMTAKVDLKSITTHDFQLGDEMRYTGYASKQGHQVQSAVVTQQQYASEEFQLLFDMDSVSLMTVTTDSIFIEDHNLHCFGTVTADDAVTERGFCWSTLPHPTIANDYTIEESGTGSFSSTLTGLDPHQPYYLRAYATNNNGTAYGNEFHIRISNSYTQIDTAFLPDGQDCGNGCSYISSINVTGFPYSATVQSPNDILFVRIKLEHSFVGDLWIALTCPNGQLVSILKKYQTTGTSGCTGAIPQSEWGWVSSGSSGADFGIRLDDDYSNKCNPATNPMGTPWNYVWSENTVNGYQYSSYGNYVYANSNVNNGIMDSTNVAAMTNVFHPEGSFSNLIGCPLNGTWSIQVVDGWASDNGWMTEWELALDGFPLEPVMPETTGACPGVATVNDYDGNIYNTVQIGDRCWMKENLRTTHYASGAPISQGGGADAAAAHFYLPAMTGTDAFGYLYNWKAVTGQDGGAQGICPDGWHVPTDAEWLQLTDYMGGLEGYICDDNPNYIAQALAADTFWNPSTNPCAVGNDLSMNNASGFSALPAGLFNGTSGQFGTNACFWTATSNNDYAYYHSMSYDNGFVECNQYGDKAFGMSVRCVLSETPKVSTAAVTDIIDSSALCGGEVISTGGAPVTERGLCWRTDFYPTVADAHIDCGDGLGSFTGQMTGLEPGTTYYVRAYATSAAGTVYGTSKIFTTLARPTVITQNVDNILDSTATCGGNVTSDGGVPVTARGVCWSTSPAPTVMDSHTTDSTGTGIFSSQMTGLVPNTTYYVRAYATNTFGTVYGDQKTFTTKTIPTVFLDAVTNILSISASCTYHIIDNGGMPVTDRGICYSTLPNPTLNDNVMAGMGDYGTMELTGLTPGTTYYARAYATNAIGTGYSESSTFTTLSIPTVTTAEASDVSFFTATCGGEVLATGVPEITARGVCWSTTQNPTIADSHTSDSTGYGTFTSQLTGLELHTTYYVRAYATNSSGTGYGNQISFTTLNIPAVTTKTVTSILDSTAVCGGNITSDGGGAILAKGICWSTGSMPTIDDSIATDTSGLSNYTCTMTGLIPNTTYHVRAFATNGGGTAYGSQRTFTTKEIPTVTLDSATNILSLTASCTYHVTNNGGMSVTDRGVCYDTLANPTLDDNVVLGTGNNGTVQLSGLVPGTTYYVRAFATNGAGTGYSNEISFTTLTIPTVITAAVDDIDFFSATGGGEVLATGVPDILVRGLCWSTSQNPTLDDSHTIDSIPADSTGFGMFMSQMTGLESNTTYYVRAYATNSYGTGYGDQVSFTTLKTPTVNTKSVTNITDSSATCGGNVTSIGGGAILAKGICWSTLENPTIADSIAVDTTAQNNFTCTMTGLTSGTTYYVRAFATNGGGTAYGSQKTFTTKGIPTITLDSAMNILSLTASCTYHVTYSGGVSVTYRGVCYDTLANPTIDDNVVAGTANNGTVQLSGLAPGTTYYVRAFATNSYGTGYSNEISFTTLSIPTVTTAAVSNVAPYTATCGGEVLSTDVPAIVVRGICWSTSPNPTIADNLTNDGSGFGTFTSQLTGLLPNTTYYIRAYAINNYGTGYGNQVSFTTIRADGFPCLGIETITDIDSNIYNTVQIGQQCWIKENLRTTHYPDGEFIPVGGDSEDMYPTRYAPNNNEANVPTYGYLYSWSATMHGAASSNSNPSGVQGICPDGWHVPSHAEWLQLFDYVGSQSDYLCTRADGSSSYASALASSTGWLNYDYETGGWPPVCSPGWNSNNNNATGFSAMPAGFHQFHIYGSFGRYGNYWSSTQSDANQCHAYFWGWALDTVCITTFTFFDSEGISRSSSVRCIRNANWLPSVSTNPVSCNSNTMAFISGDISNEGSASITARGVCWSTSHNPTISDSHTSDGTGTGSFSSTITGLQPSTTYYVRAYATNIFGTEYGGEMSFTTLASNNTIPDGQPCPCMATVTDIDNNTYNTVKVGDQCWMKENLRVLHYTNGENIPSGNQWSYTVSYYYDYSSDFPLENRGYLYNWAAVMHGENSSSANPSGVQGICPTGWHVPSNVEWIQLSNYMGQGQYGCGISSMYFAKALASTTGWDSCDVTCAIGNTPSTNNATGFSAFPAGHWYNGGFNQISTMAIFWSSTENDDTQANRRVLTHQSLSMSSGGYYDKRAGYSVRCIRDE